jgi:Xaa-Pro aminopeptidase
MAMIIADRRVARSRLSRKSALQLLEEHRRQIVLFDQQTLVGEAALAHSFGVGQHEFPVLTPFAPERYEVGMIFMIEPMGIDRRVGGFSIEDMILITEAGPKILSDAVGSEEMIVIGD